MEYTKGKLDFNSVTRELPNEQIKDFVNQATIIYFGGAAAVAKHISRQSILDEILGEYAQRGFKLVEPDDYHLDLYFKGKRIATYNQHIVIIEVLKERIRDGCKNYLANIIRSL